MHQTTLVDCEAPLVMPDVDMLFRSATMRTMASGAFLLLIAGTLAAQTATARIGDGFIQTRDGVRIHYLEAGRGPALLFIPGFTGPAEFWEAQILAFSTSHRAIAIDPRLAR